MTWKKYSLIIFFFYNVNSYDLYFVGIKGFEDKKNLINLIYERFKILFKRKKIRKMLTYIYSISIGENLRQDIYFYKRFLIKSIKKFLTIG